MDFVLFLLIGGTITFLLFRAHMILRAVSLNGRIVYFNESAGENIRQKLLNDIKEKIEHPRLPNILYVDDDKLLCEVAGRFFRGDAKFTFAHNGRDALRLLEYGVFDGVILDVDLGIGMDGVDVFKEIREKDKNLPVLFVTGYAGSQKLIDALKFGTYIVMQKPVDMSLLRPVIETFMDH